MGMESKTDMIFYYFHGYGSGPEAKKCKIMKKVLGEEKVKAPDFREPSVKKIQILLDSLIETIKETREEVCLVGSSLGGLYALYVSALSGCRCILLNPCLFPQLIIPKITKTFPPEEIAAAQNLNLRAYVLYDPQKVRVWVAKNDELIDHEALTRPFFYRPAAEYRKFSKNIASGHNFKGFRKVLEKYL